MSIPRIDIRDLTDAHYDRASDLACMIHSVGLTGLYEEDREEAQRMIDQTAQVFVIVGGEVGRHASFAVAPFATQKEAEQWAARRRLWGRAQPLIPSGEMIDDGNFVALFPADDEGYNIAGPFAVITRADDWAKSNGKTDWIVKALIAPGDFRAAAGDFDDEER